MGETDKIKKVLKKLLHEINLIKKDVKFLNNRLNKHCSEFDAHKEPIINDFNSFF